MSLNITEDTPQLRTYEVEDGVDKHSGEIVTLPPSPSMMAR
ncbi:MAG: hypothetical protein ACTS73_08515 [Arsenophonus sp. NEOnobi-MAG3]